MTDQIIGAGGGGSQRSAGGSQKVEKDNLDSRQVARIVDLVSEGEIEGPATPARLGLTRGTVRYADEMLKDVYFNNTPIVRAGADVSSGVSSTDRNFQTDTVTVRFGAEHGVQGPLSEVSDTVQEEFAVGTVVAEGTPVTRTITDQNVTAVRVTLNVPQLQQFRDNGDVTGTFVDYRIQVSYNGGAFTNIVVDTIKGRTVDLYQRMKYFELDMSQSKPVQIRVIRDTVNDADRTGDDTFNSEIIWSSYTEHVYGKFTYPHSAFFGHKIDAKQFSRVPDRKYRIRGIKVKIPNNATVDADNGRLIYDGLWTGTFGAAAWTTDPAWILYDLLINKRYGFGQNIKEEQLNKFNFYDCSQYCAGLVPDGFGGQEPRFACNINIQTQSEAFDLINQMASIFRAQPYWSAGALALTMDRPQDPELIFTQSNVTEEGFSYSGSSIKTRHTCVSVSYLDLDIRDTAYELVEDEDAIKKFGVIKKSIKAVGCTSRGQARRLGEWLLYSENRETETCSFTTRMAEGTKVRPGMIIKVADPFRANRFRGGRVKPGSTGNVIKLDRTVDDMFPNGLPATFSLNIMLRVREDNQDVVRQVSVGDIDKAQWSGDTITLPSGSELEYVPTANSVFAIGTDGLRPSLWRVIGVVENEEGTYSVTALTHETGKYDFVERDVPLQPRDVTALDNPAGQPTNLVAEERLYESNGQVYVKIILSWQPGTDSARSIVRWRYENGNWNEFPTFANDYEILNATDGDYEFEVIGQSAGFLNSPPAKRSFTAEGKTAPPATIPDLFIAPIDQHRAELHWPQSTDLDVRIGGTIRIRHTPVIGASATWARTNDIVDAATGNSTRMIVPLVEGTYFIRAVDSTGNESPGTASVVVDLPEPQDLFIAQTYREDDDTPAFQGTKTNMIYSSAETALILESSGLVDDITDFDSLSDLDNFGDTKPSGSYEFLSTLDLGAKYDLELLQTLKTRAYTASDFWDSRTGLIDTWVDIDGTDTSRINAQTYVRSTNDDPSGSPTYGGWQPFVNGIKRGRGFQFKVEAATTEPAQNIAIEELGVTTRLQRRTEQERNITSGSSAKAVTFPAAFYGTPSVGITAQDMDSGDYFQISSISRTGFTVTFKNSSDTIISKTFDYQAVGHGREIT
jgi:predicted phage tail protein|tara:strand:- start:3094 stop:6498 length:3405 start_codon:yes stop_codon:yes gene_type:complete